MLSLDRIGPVGSCPSEGLFLMVGSNGTGDLLFRFGGENARIVEVVCDFGPIAGIRILAMNAGLDGSWSLRLPAGVRCRRYRFRIDGKLIHDPDVPRSFDQQTWRELPKAA